LEICHRCDNPPCVNPAHLFEGTRTDNARDMREKGRSATGDKNGSHTHRDRVARGSRAGAAKLSEDDVLVIKDFIGRGRSRRSIAREFGVASSTIDRIAWNQAWVHVRP
jgi:FixJ family two-component response regulator